ncbi:hypothetical protein HN51_043750 [Arachis hypogaea]|uniref:DUF1995 domain-containing protein n=1 Tax=Arachis hypogaea TaxID=3818 RepID=A0A444Y5E5_ARAHY|nr:uncharacterized protein LOC107613321 [Arachis ipaensis]XP_029150998.1 uncharacterized protein LOC112771251 [Arachis hypogaea]RYQ97138.1 hypothetical protein Ahy_B08g093151 [Arachis hypogaea]
MASLSFLNSNYFHSIQISKPSSSSLTCIHSSLSSPNPPNSKDEAIQQAKTSISTTLEKPLNNSSKLIGKFKKLKQPKFRVEIPLIDGSPDSISQLALDVFGDIPIKRKGSPIKVLVLWPNPRLREAANAAFKSQSDTKVEHFDIPSLQNRDPRILNSADVAVFFVPEVSQLDLVRTVSDAFNPRPVVMFNPKWAFEEEGNFDDDLSGFVNSFEVIYCFMGLEVRGLLSKRKGVVFRCVRDGVVSGEKWNVFVEEGEEMKLVSTLKARPTIVEVENVLYNVMAMNSPITKSAKFIKGLVSNVTGRK